MSLGESYTLFVSKTGFTGTRALKDDFSAPPSGKARIRVVRSGTDISSGAIDVCASSESWGSALGTNGQGSYATVAPAAAIELREAAAPACAGALLGSATLEVAADHTYSAFVIDDQTQASQALFVLCQDGASGQQIFNGSCSETPVK